MKTTLLIDDEVMVQLKQEAARQGTTMSELVDAALRKMLAPEPLRRSEIPQLPVFHGGRLLVDIADREALYEALEAA